MKTPSFGERCWKSCWVASVAAHSTQVALQLRLRPAHPLRQQRVRQLRVRVLGLQFHRNWGDAQIGPGVHIYTAFHPLDSSTRRSGLEGAKPVTIGNSVWLGGCCVVGPGVSIGDNTVIGAGNVVVRDIPANKLAVGNPCRVVRPMT